MIRPARLSDVDSIALLIRERLGGELELHSKALRVRLAKSRGRAGLHLVAEIGGQVVAYAAAGFFRPPADAPANAAPAGWYLTGVNVEQSMRRQGIASLLTEHRLAWLARRAGEAFYFANSQNRASIDLHARFGFAELTRNFWFPGASFAGGVGVLFRVELDRDASPLQSPRPWLDGEADPPAKP